VMDKRSIRDRVLLGAAYFAGIVIGLSLILYVWIEFIKVCNWLGAFTWP
jgi:hypothetical protein